MRTLHLVAAAALLVSPASGAFACTFEGARIASEARERAQLRMKKVKGFYNVISKSETEAEDWYSSTKEKITVTTFVGRITTKRGIQYETQHSDDGYIIMCATSFSPKADAEGVFYLSKRKNKDTGRYDLEDWEGDYLPVLDAAPSSKSEK